MSGEHPFDLIVFDLDGTLIDSAPDMARALNRTLTAFGRRPVSEEEVRGMVGDGAGGLIRQAFETTGAPAGPAEAEAALTHYLDAYLEEDAAPDCLYPGVVDVLTALSAAGMRLALCTNKSERIARKVIGQVGIAGFFVAVAGGDSAPARKPDPRHLAWTVDAAGGGRVVMVGDNANDVKAARGLGAPVVAVSYGYPRMSPADLGADALIDRFADLPAALTALAARP